MNVEAYRNFRLLTVIASDVAVTQRSLAKQFGLALGLTNFLIRRLVRKGYIKITALERKRLQYFLTPKGLAAKARLTYEYLDYSLNLYRSIRMFVAHELSAIAQSADKETVLIGTSEVAEITFLILQQHGVRVTAVLDPSSRGQTLFMGQSVRKLEALQSLTYDWVVVASFQDTHQIRNRLATWGIPKSKLITIPNGRAFAEFSQGIPGALGSVSEALIEVPRP